MHRKTARYWPIIPVLAVLFAAGCGKDSSTGNEPITYTNLTVTLMDDFNRPVVNANVTTSPETVEVVTDQNGIAVFEQIPARKYALVINHTGYPLYIEDISLEKVDTQTVNITMQSQKPVATIIFPTHDSFISNRAIRLEGHAVDAEDGILPDSLCVWQSNVDGIIGKGRELVLDSLTLGSHVLTFIGTDGDGKSGQDSITITVVDYDPASYFPIPYGAQWIYHHTKATVTLLNDNEKTETWTLKDISVEIDMNNRRIAKISYTKRLQGKAEEYHYTVIDDLRKNGNAIEVTNTVETLEIWNGDAYGNPNNKLVVETEYTPAYVIVPETYNPVVNSTSEYVVNVASTWSYYDPATGQQDFTERFIASTTVEYGEPVEIKIEGVTYATIPMTITQGDLEIEAFSKRRWWLARGIGIVKLAYNSFQDEPEAGIFSTNLSNYGSLATPEKRVAQPAYYGAAPLVAVDVPAENGIARMRRIRDILRQRIP